MIGERQMREEFGVFVAEWTGRDLEYHERNQTGGIEFAWECWKRAATRAEVRAIYDQFPAIKGPYGQEAAK